MASIFLRNIREGAGEAAKQLGAFPALPKDLNSVLSNYATWITAICTLAPGHWKPLVSMEICAHKHIFTCRYILTHNLEEQEQNL